ncbi:MAG: class I SAM-dependent methyltransferase [Desulfobacterales bacterium]|nr:class I SAM-dependent methyltransferase [Desulfobacterales bacterium]
MRSLTRFFSEQARTPRGLFGRFFMSRVFDRGNLPLNRFVEQTLALNGHEQLLEIGYGTGLLIAALARQLTTGAIHGIDLSETMAAIAKKKNRSSIRGGKVTLDQGDFNTVPPSDPYDGNRFDAVFTVNTIYFWPEPQRTLAGIHRVLKPGGRLIIGFHDNAYLKKQGVDRDIFTYYTVGDVSDLLSKTFKSVDIRVEKGENAPCYCAVAFK